jgi:hypothetical protein
MESKVFLPSGKVILGRPEPLLSRSKPEQMGRGGTVNGVKSFFTKWKSDFGKA